MKREQKTRKVVISESGRGEERRAWIILYRKDGDDDDDAMLWIFYLDADLDGSLQSREHKETEGQGKPTELWRGVDEVSTGTETRQKERRRKEFPWMLWEESASSIQFFFSLSLFVRRDSVPWRRRRRWKKKERQFRREVLHGLFKKTKKRILKKKRGRDVDEGQEMWMRSSSVKKQTGVSIFLRRLSITGNGRWTEREKAPRESHLSLSSLSGWNERKRGEMAGVLLHACEKKKKEMENGREDDQSNQERRRHEKLKKALSIQGERERKQKVETMRRRREKKKCLARRRRFVLSQPLFGCMCTCWFSSSLLLQREKEQEATCHESID